MTSGDDLRDVMLYPHPHPHPAGLLVLADWYHLEMIRRNTCLEHPHPAGLLVFADWYHLETIRSVRFYDDNTRAWWDAATGELQGACHAHRPAGGAGEAACLSAAPAAPRQWWLTPGASRGRTQGLSAPTQTTAPCGLLSATQLSSAQRSAERAPAASHLVRPPSPLPPIQAAPTCPP